MEVDVILGSNITAGMPKELFDVGPFRADMARSWSMTGDGQRFLFVTRAGDGDQIPFHGLAELDGGVEEMMPDHTLRARNEKMQ